MDLVIRSSTKLHNDNTCTCNEPMDFNCYQSLNNTAIRECINHNYSIHFSKYQSRSYNTGWYGYLVAFLVCVYRHQIWRRRPRRVRWWVYRPVSAESRPRTPATRYPEKESVQFKLACHSSRLCSKTAKCTCV